ncbi:MAG: ABC transporter transmembrane domain-containing protein [Pelolinea sp.]|nr:ABC transporter transmembrane domain-containing protein [Pelolinea sp.]
MAEQNKQNKRPQGPAHGMGPIRGVIEKPKDVKKSIQRTASYFAAYKVELIFVFFLVILYTLAGLAGPYLMGVAIDGYITEKDLPGLTRIALIMLGAYLLSLILQAIANWIMANASQKALKKMRTDLFHHLQFLSLRFFDRNPAGDLMSRLTNDINAINQAVSMNVTSL